MQSLFEKTSRWMRGLPVLLVVGVPVVASGLAAQQNEKPTLSDSATCASIAAYPASHPDEMKQMQQGVTQLMRSPEVQQAMMKAMQAAMQQARNGKSGQPGRVNVSGDLGNLDFTKLPDTTRRAVAQAVRSGQFDQAKALLQPALGNDSIAILGLQLGFKVLALMPDSLRSLLGNSLERGRMDSCGGFKSTMVVDSNKAVIEEAKPLPPPVIRSDSTSPSH